MLFSNLAQQTGQAAGAEWLRPLREFLSTFAENRHIQALLVVAVSLVVAKISELFLIRVMGRITRRTRSEIDDQVLALLHRPIFFSLALAGIAIALKLEQPPETFGLVIFGFLSTLVIIIWLVYGVRLAVLILTWMARHPERFHVVQAATLPLFEMTAKVVLFGAALYFLLVSWEIDPTGWAASAGIIGIAVGFAARDTLANLFAGISILADAPYKVGDFIVLDDQRGQVTKIGLRSTRILTQDDIEITIPNSIIANSKIINETGGPSVRHRLRIPVGVAYSSDVDLVPQVLTQVAEENQLVCKDPEPRVRFRGFGDSSLNFELLCWIEDSAQKGLVQHLLNTAIFKALARAGIEIPFPKRDLYIKELPGEGALDS